MVTRCRTLPPLLLVAVIACSSSTPTADVTTTHDLALEGVHDAARADTAVDLFHPDLDLSGPTHLPRLESSADFLLLKGPKGDLKHLMRVDGRTPPAPLDGECAFQNTRRFPYHINFLHYFPEFATVDVEQYLDMVLRNATRVWWGGIVLDAPAVVHPKTGIPGVMVYTVYQDGGSAEALTVEQLVEVDQRIKGCVPYTSQSMVLVPSDPEQMTHLKTIEAQLAAQGVYVVYKLQ